MNNPIATYTEINRTERRPSMPIIDVLIDACLHEVEKAQAELRMKERDLQEMACRLFDIWWSDKNE